VIHDEAGQHEKERYRGAATVQNCMKAFRGDGSEAMQVGDDDAQRGKDAQAGKFGNIARAGLIGNKSLLCPDARPRAF
jgi:hypothetical protein